jgi:hypothetical protein
MCATRYTSEEIDGQTLLDDVGVAQIVVERDAGIVDENVERADLGSCALDLLNAVQDFLSMPP